MTFYEGIDSFIRPMRQQCVEHIRQLNADVSLYEVDPRGAVLRELGPMREICLRYSSLKIKHTFYRNLAYNRAGYSRLIWV